MSKSATNLKWKRITIGALISEVKTSNPSRAIDDEFDYIDIGSVDQERKKISAVKSILGVDAPSRARQILASGDILISTVRPNLNAVAVVPEEYDGAIGSTGFCVLRAQRNLVDLTFLFQWVKSSEFISDMVKKATGASYPAVSDRIILESEIPLPPLPVQRRIAQILDKAEALQTKRRAALAKLDTLAQSIFLEMFGGLKENDKGWKKSKIGQAGKAQLGRQRAPQYQTGKFTRPYVRVANVYEDRLSLGDVLSMDFDENDFLEYKLEYGDILLNEGQSTELVGRPAMWRDEIQDCCFQNTLIRFQPDKTRLIPDFVMDLFLAYYRSGEFSKLSSKTSSVAHLGLSRFVNLEIPLPPIGLQNQYVDKKRAIETLKAAHRASLAKLDALFASLQHRAFRGEL